MSFEFPPGLPLFPVWVEDNSKLKTENSRLF